MYKGELLHVLTLSIIISKIDKVKMKIFLEKISLKNDPL